MRKPLKRLSKLSRAIALSSLSLLLSACTSKVTTQVEYIYPPQAYTTPCVKTKFTGETYGDVVLQLVKVTAERDKCAAQIDNINKWIEQTKGSQ
ncbi:Rz1-like lysis system protein LysC [Aggregatibacter actinomycetemcomitans]|uniref:Rz1-like lysis system protein LysC n=1 Tax=Aggregatibacter actinomycetemcomitans TaxID=714 RepID=UPI003B986D62